MPRPSPLAKRREQLDVGQAQEYEHSQGCPGHPALRKKCNCDWTDEQLDHRRSTRRGRGKDCL